MSYTVRDNTEVDGKWHEVTDVSGSGNYVTKCQRLVGSGGAVVATQADESVTCENCINPPKPAEVKPRRPRDPNAKPQWRTPKNRHAEMIQGLQFAHKAIVAAIEWAQRGESLQFLEQSLDQSHLGYRFLKEILVDYRRIEDDEVPEED